MAFLNESHTRSFFGREKLLREIVQGVLAAQPMDFALVAPKFCGKTRLLDHLASAEGPLRGELGASWRPMRFQDQNRVVVVLIDCNWPGAKQNLLAYLADRLREEIEEQKPFRVDWNQVNQEVSASQQLRLLAGEATQQGFRIVMLLNNFDAVLQEELLSQVELNELRPLTTELALVVATRQPLHDIDQELASSPLFNVLRPLFVGLLEHEAAAAWIAAYRQDFPELAEKLTEPLIEITGGHPFLLARLRETLLEVQKMLPAGKRIDRADFALIELRLAEHGRLLFESLAQTLEAPPERIAGQAVETLLSALTDNPVPVKSITPDQNAAINWLINQAVVVYREQEYRLFTPLFASFLRHRRQTPDTSRPAPSTRIITRVETDNSYTRLPRMEADLLSYLRAHANEVVSPEELLTQVWKLPAATSPRRVQEAIRRLRNHLKDEAEPIGVIENERGQGYRFVPL